VDGRARGTAGRAALEFAALLSREDDIGVVAGSDGDGDVVARAVACRPDVAVIGVDSGEGEEIAVLGELRARLPECRMLLMTASTTPARLCLSAAP
jgi:two-component system response regulator DesR